MLSITEVLSVVDGVWIVYSVVELLLVGCVETESRVDARLTQLAR